MKSSWQTVHVREILRLEYGKPLDPGDRKPNGRYPVYGANGETDRTDKFYVDRPSIIVGRKGSVGELNLTEARFWPLDVTYFVKFDDAKYDLRFLFYLLRTLDLPSFAKGVKPGLNREEAYAQVTRVPPLHDQKRIVHVLDEAFGRIAIAKAAAQQNLKNARAIFDSYLDAEISRCDREWPSVAIGAACKTGAGGTPLKSRKDYHDGGTIPWILSGEVGQGDVRTATHFITEAGLRNSSARLFPKGTVLIAMYGATAGEVGILRIEAATNQAVCGILPAKEFLPEFMFYTMLSRKKALAAQAIGNAQPNISQIKIKNTVVPMVPLSVQEEFVSRMHSLLGHSKSLETGYQRKIQLLNALEISLMRQALSGQL